MNYFAKDSDRTERPWGYYRVLHEHETSTTKVKEIVLNPGSSISYQRHELRSELWFVMEGEATVILNDTTKKIGVHEHTWVPVGNWHQLKNETDAELKIIEIQYGKLCVEKDIERENDSSSNGRI